MVTAVKKVAAEVPDGDESHVRSVRSMLEKEGLWKR